MTDRQLLELAAKAAGFNIKPHANYKLSERLIFVMNGKNWNPLTDDGDALRLAVKLKMEVYQYSDAAGVYDRDNEIVEVYSTDEYAATRRAIVRAAAQIGEKP